MTSDRLATLTSWNADWKGLRVAVLGLSVTGFSVADTLADFANYPGYDSGQNNW